MKRTTRGTTRSTTTTRWYPTFVSFGDSRSDRRRQSGCLRWCGRRRWLRGQKRVASRHPTTSTLRVQKRQRLFLLIIINMPWRIGRQLPFLRSILKLAHPQTRRERLQSANDDQINALSELVMNMLQVNLKFRLK